MTPAEQATRVALYCRVSTAEQSKDGVSLAMQARRMLSWSPARLRRSSGVIAHLRWARIDTAVHHRTPQFGRQREGRIEAATAGYAGARERRFSRTSQDLSPYLWTAGRED